MELKRKMLQESILLKSRATAILPTKKENNSYCKEIVVLSKRNNCERCQDVNFFLQNLTFLLRGFVVENAEYAICNRLCSAKRIVNW